METAAILQQPIATLSLRQETIQLAQAMGYHTLQDLFDTPKKDLFEKPGFTYRWFFEVCGFLDRNGLLAEFEGSK